METMFTRHIYDDLVSVKVDQVELQGSLVIPEGATGIVVLVNGGGNSCYHPCNIYLAKFLRKVGFATLIIDLLTLEEEAIDARTKHLHFDIELLASRLAGCTAWLAQYPHTHNLAVGYFGANTGAGAALVAAATLAKAVQAVVSRGGRVDLAGSALSHVQAPTLMIVGGYDTPLILMNKFATAQLNTQKQLKIIPQATHLFAEAGKLEAVAELASDWFTRYLPKEKISGFHQSLLVISH
ncbi:dienelactone hydrolase family protein [Nostoc sp. TCL26-01]|uniref:dienelactone hydrolase family protein n=1 Tax=Nostoc sp. TCL26-01 TaxID=2576904 RepID=UPI0021191222|nr:dienelactone hydrolase family protein [Nostoc sp. TCL26-01]QLE57688.1 alpha/beta hydrolase [Nostoc sp. TCL26-01]